jgi:hypothetical protein
MSKFKTGVSALLVMGMLGLAATSFAKAAPKRCGFNGDYSFFFWDPSFPVSGVGFFTVQLNPATKCRSGVVLPGGILNCNFAGGDIFEDFIEDGFVFLESDGEGTMEIETNSSDGICGTGTNAIELDVSLVSGGKSMLFNSDGEEFASSGLIPQAGYQGTLTGRADKCFAGQISGCYDVRFWSQSGDAIKEEIDPQPIPIFDSAVGDCTICVNGAGAVTGGTCRCNINADEFGGFETLSEIEGGGYTLGENCQSSTGYLWIVTSSDEICDISSFLALDFAAAQQGKELIGACDTDEFILNNEAEDNAGFFMPCAFEGFLQ